MDNKPKDQTKFEDVVLESFYTRDTVPGIVAEFYIPTTIQRTGFLALHSNYKDSPNIAIGFYHPDYGHYTTPCVYLSYRVKNKSRDGVLIKIEIPDINTVETEHILSLIHNKKINLIFYEFGDEIPKNNIADNKSLNNLYNRKIHYYINLLAIYEGLPSKDYKDQLKQRLGISSFGDLSTDEKKNIADIVETQYENLQGTDDYKRVNSKCEVCGTTVNIEVHHMKLRSQADKQHVHKFKYLMTLCRTHHDLFHEDAQKFARMFQLPRLRKARPDLF